MTDTTDTTGTTPTDAQKQRAKWDLLLADLEYRQEQLRLARQDIRWKPWQVAFSAMMAGAALFAAGAAFIKLLG
jgi:hypothetical protein